MQRVIGNCRQPHSIPFNKTFSMKTFVYIGKILDNFIAKEDDNLDWLSPFDDEETATAFKDLLQALM